MQITFSKNNIKRKQYINFRMRKLIYARIFELTNDEQIAQNVANECETIVCENFFVKDKRRVNQQNIIVSINKKIA